MWCNSGTFTAFWLCKHEFRCLAIKSILIFCEVVGGSRMEFGAGSERRSLSLCHSLLPSFCVCMTDHCPGLCHCPPETDQESPSRDHHLLFHCVLRTAGSTVGGWGDCWPSSELNQQISVYSFSSVCMCVCELLTPVPESISQKMLSYIPLDIS